MRAPKVKVQLEPRSPPVSSLDSVGQRAKWGRTKASSGKICRVDRAIRMTGVDSHKHSFARLPA